MREHIASLTTFCGVKSDVSSPLENLRPHIRYFADQASTIVGGGHKTTFATISPFVGRGLLEASFTALLFRIDPFRALTLMRFQSHEEFDHNRPQQISINWGTDIVSDTENNKDIWLPKQKPELVSRALLSPYTDSVIWQPAFIEARDFADKNGISFAFPSALNVDPDSFVARIRGESRQLYSFWSKGIHCEFFAMGSHILDHVTCADKMKRTADLVADLALISHFTSVSVGNLSAKKAFDLYRRSKESLYV